MNGLFLADEVQGVGIFEQFWNDIVSFFTNIDNYWTALYFVAILVLGFLVVKLLIRGITAAFNRNKHIDKMLSHFLLSIIRVLLYFVYVILIASAIGIDSGSLVAILGSLGLALSLAMQDSLSSVANGILILINKPFKADDYIGVDGVEGTVESIRILSTRLITPDNKTLIIPNSKVASSTVINYSSEETRRVDHSVGVAYDTDINKLTATIDKIVKADNRILPNPAYVLKLTGFGSSELSFSLRYWVKTADYWGAFFDTNEAILKAFREEGIEIPFNQVDVNIKK